MKNVTDGLISRRLDIAERIGGLEEIIEISKIEMQGVKRMRKSRKTKNWRTNGKGVVYV